MTLSRGAVVWSGDPFKDDSDAGRPWLVINNDRQPFRDEQSMTVALSTSGYDAAMPIEPDKWLEGELPRRSYVLPWAVHSLDHRDVDQQFGQLAPEFVDEIVGDLRKYVERTH